MSLTTAQIAVRRQWVEALRSGKYRQVRGELRGDAPDEFCAIGLVARGPLRPAVKRFQRTHPDLTGNEIFYAVTGLDRRAHLAIVEMNNGWGNYLRHDFAEIADTIELLTLAGE